jgi:multidrug resistance efflux pump
MQALDNDRVSGHAVAFGLLAAGLGLWLTWCVAARVAVYAATSNAQLAVERGPHPVDAPIEGRIVVAPGLVGSTVRAGDVLLELDANLERLARKETQARLKPAAAQLASLAEQMHAEQRALEDDRRGAEAALAANQGQAEQAAAAAQLATDEARRTAALHERGLVSEVEALRAQKTAEQRAALADSAEASVQAAARDRQTQEQDRVARIASLNAAIAALEGTRDETVATAERLGYEISRRQIRAPIGGTLAEVAPLRAGSVVHAGDRILTILPAGDLKVVALFGPAEALGRVRVGQVAQVRFKGFSWTQYGSASAHVTAVSSEVRDGTIRAELSLDDARPADIPLQHGLPAEVDVEIERVTPADMILRTIGRRLGVTDQRPRT